MTIWILIGYLLGLISISFVAHMSLVRLLPYWCYRSILFPGIILHELSHALVSVLVGVRVEKIRFWGGTGGEVTHQKTNPVFQFLISLAPVVAGIAVIAIICQFLNLKPIELKLTGESFQGLISQILVSFQALDLNLANLLFLYLLVSIALTLVPSPEDLKASLTTWTVFLVTAVVLSYNQIRLPIENEKLNLVAYIGSLLILIVILSLGLNLLKFISKRIIHLW